MREGEIEASEAVEEAVEIPKTIRVDYLEKFIKITRTWIEVLEGKTSIETLKILTATPTKTYAVKKKEEKKEKKEKKAEKAKKKKSGKKKTVKKKSKKKKKSK